MRLLVSSARRATRSTRYTTARRERRRNRAPVRTDAAAPRRARDPNGDQRDGFVCCETRCATDQTAPQGAPLQRDTRPGRRCSVCRTRRAGRGQLGPASRDCCECSRAGTSYKIPGGPTLNLICVARSIKKSRPVRRLNIAGRSEQQLRAAIGAAKTTASLQAPRAVIIEVVLMRGRHRGRPGPRLGRLPTLGAACRTPQLDLH